MEFEFESSVWRWQARADDWFFATVPAELSADIREIPRPRSGFGAVRVRVRIGTSTWMTSIFPDGDTYALPLKRAVRDAEGLAEGEACVIRLDVIG